MLQSAQKAPVLETNYTTHNPPLQQQAQTQHLDRSNVYRVYYSDKHHYTEFIMEPRHLQ